MYFLKVHSVREPEPLQIPGMDDGAGGGDAGWKKVQERSGGARSVRFSSGNPRVEGSSGVVHLFRDTAKVPGSREQLPEGRCEDLCVLAVPSHMNVRDFCRYTGAFLPHIQEIKIVRDEAVEDRYMVLMKMDSQSSADEFYLHYDGQPFSSLEAEICHIVFTAGVEYTDEEKLASTPPSGLTELPSCPVCLERLDRHISGILTTMCNHTFHSACISKWEDSSCPVCRFCQDQPDQMCSVCETKENLWICLICGFIGCGRYKEGHAISHWRETQHCYSLDLHTQRVWDYVGDGYVHRLIQSKTDGKLVELVAPPCARGGGGRDDCESCSHQSEVQEAVLNSKFEAVASEYNQLLTSQLDSQRQYFEGLLADMRKEQERAVAAAAETSYASKLPKLQEKLEKAEREVAFLRELNSQLMANQKDLKTKLQMQEESRQQAVAARDEKLADLEEQVRDLMMYIEGKKTLEQSADAEELANASVMVPENVPQEQVPLASKARAARLARKHK